MPCRRAILRLATAIAALLLSGGALSGSQIAASPARAGAATGNTANLPVAGVYRYALHGTECAGVAVFKFCRAFPAQGRMILTRAAGTITVEFDYSSDHLEATRFALHPDGRYMTWQRTRLVFGITQDDAAPTVPPTLALPATLRVGEHWTQRFTTGGLPVVTTNMVTRKTTMVVGGTSVTAYEIDAASQTGGAHPGTETDVTWHAPSSGLDVQLAVHRRFGGVFPYTMDVQATLLSLTPL